MCATIVWQWYGYMREDSTLSVYVFAKYFLYVNISMHQPIKVDRRSGNTYVRSNFHIGSHATPRGSSSYGSLITESFSETLFKFYVRTYVLLVRTYKQK